MIRLCQTSAIILSSTPGIFTDKLWRQFTIRAITVIDRSDKGNFATTSTPVFMYNNNVLEDCSVALDIDLASNLSPAFLNKVNWGLDGPVDLQVGSPAGPTSSLLLAPLELT